MKKIITRRPLATMVNVIYPQGERIKLYSAGSGCHREAPSMPNESSKMTVLTIKINRIKKYLLLSALLWLMSSASSQANWSQKSKPPSLAEVNKMMEAEMKGMSAQEKAEMRKM